MADKASQIVQHAADELARSEQRLATREARLAIVKRARQLDEKTNAEEASSNQTRLGSRVDGVCTELEMRKVLREINQVSKTTRFRFSGSCTKTWQTALAKLREGIDILEKVDELLSDESNASPLALALLQLSTVFDKETDFGKELVQAVAQYGREIMEEADVEGGKDLDKLDMSNALSTKIQVAREAKERAIKQHLDELKKLSTRTKHVKKSSVGKVSTRRDR